MNNVIGKVRRALDEYSMINDNDKVAIALSGGKDSVALLVALCEIKKYYSKKFEVIAITLDPCFNNKKTDFSSISKLCEKLNVQHIIKKTNLWEIIFDIRKERSPCSLCAKMRRGILHTVCIEHNCQRIALGHHQDDAIETFLMNLFHNGKLECFSPLSYLSRRNLFMIRPMILCNEKEIKNFIFNYNLPTCKSNCPMDGHTERENFKNLTNLIESKYPNLRKNLINSLKKSNLNNW